MPKQQDVDVGPQDDPEVAVERRDVADGLGPVVVQAVGPVGALDDDRDGQERHELLADADRPGPGPAAAVRGGEGLVQVQVDDVEAQVARAGPCRRWR